MLLFSIRNFFLYSIIFLIFSSLIFITAGTAAKYQGENVLVYILFSLISNYLLFFSLREKSFFFETFFGFFLWVGFWFKYSFITLFDNSVFREGYSSEIILSKKVIDDSLLVASFAIMAFILSGYLREVLLNYPKKICFEYKLNFYEKFRKVILFFFLLLILLITSLNFFFEVYQKGIVAKNNFLFFSEIIKYLLYYGLSAISALILYYEISTLKKISATTFILTILETFLSSVSMLSRGMIFNSSSLLFAFYKLRKKINSKFNFIFFFKIIVFAIILFYISLVFVNYARVKYFNIGLYLTEHSQQLTLEKKIQEINNNKIQHSYTFDKIYSVAISRWVGIDSMLLLNHKKNILNFNLLKQSFEEKFDKNDMSFYEKYFTYKKNYLTEINTRIKGNTLPGLVAYLYYSGSAIFVFFSMMFLCFFASLIEFFCFKLSNKNIFLCSLIGQIIAYRFAHFGYLPASSYKLFLSIILTIIVVFLFQKILKLLIQKT